MKPVLIEAMTYRIGHHSTSDDSTAYRSVDEARYWHQKDHPITRLRKYMEKQGWWSDDEEKSWKEESRKQVMQAFIKGEKVKKSNVKMMFTDVYDEMPNNLDQQYAELIEHLKLYKEHYPIKNFDGMDKELS